MDYTQSQRVSIRKALARLNSEYGLGEIVCVHWALGRYTTRAGDGTLYTYWFNVKGKSVTAQSHTFGRSNSTSI